MTDAETRMPPPLPASPAPPLAQPQPKNSLAQPQPQPRTSPAPASVQNTAPPPLPDKPPVAQIQPSPSQTAPPAQPPVAQAQTQIQNTSPSRPKPESAEPKLVLAIAAFNDTVNQLGVSPTLAGQHATAAKPGMSGLVSEAYDKCGLFKWKLRSALSLNDWVSMLYMFWQLRTTPVSRQWTTPPEAFPWLVSMAYMMVARNNRKDVTDWLAEIASKGRPPPAAVETELGRLCSALVLECAMMLSPVALHPLAQEPAVEVDFDALYAA